MNWNVYLESSPPRGILEVLGAVVMILILVFLTRRIRRTIQRRAMRKLLLGGAKAWNKWRQEHPEKRHDFRGANLRGADLRDVDLRYADLYGADLSGANLRGANLEWAKLFRANLRRADLRGANLKWADLIRANLRGADLRGANLRSGRFYFADLSNADLLGAKWARMEISKANIWGIKTRGFKEWALKHDAVEVEPGTDVWKQWRAILDLTCDELKELATNPKAACQRLYPYLWATDPDVMQNLEDWSIKFPETAQKARVKKVMEWIRIRARHMGCRDW